MTKQLTLESLKSENLLINTTEEKVVYDHSSSNYIDPIRMLKNQAPFRHVKQNKSIKKKNIIISDLGIAFEKELDFIKNKEFNYLIQKLIKSGFELFIWDSTKSCLSKPLKHIHDLHDNIKNMKLNTSKEIQDQLDKWQLISANYFILDTKARIQLLTNLTNNEDSGFYCDKYDLKLSSTNIENKTKSVNLSSNNFIFNNPHSLIEIERELSKLTPIKVSNYKITKIKQITDYIIKDKHNKYSLHLDTPIHKLDWNIVFELINKTKNIEELIISYDNPYSSVSMYIRNLDLIEEINKAKLDNIKSIILSNLNIKKLDLTKISKLKSVFILNNIIIESLALPKKIESLSLKVVNCLDTSKEVIVDYSFIKSLKSIKKIDIDINNVMYAENLLNNVTETLQSLNIKGIFLDEKNKSKFFNSLLNKLVELKELYIYCSDINFYITSPVLNLDNLLYKLNNLKVLHLYNLGPIDIDINSKCKLEEFLYYNYVSYKSVIAINSSNLKKIKLNLSSVSKIIKGLECKNLVSIDITAHEDENTKTLGESQFNNNIQDILWLVANNDKIINLKLDFNCYKFLFDLVLSLNSKEKNNLRYLKLRFDIDFNTEELNGKKSVLHINERNMPKLKILEIYDSVIGEDYNSGEYSASLNKVFYINFEKNNSIIKNNTNYSNILNIRNLNNVEDLNVQFAFIYEHKDFVLDLINLLKDNSNIFNLLITTTPCNSDSKDFDGCIDENFYSGFISSIPKQVYSCSISNHLNADLNNIDFSKHNFVDLDINFPNNKISFVFNRNLRILSSNNVQGNLKECNKLVGLSATFSNFIMDEITNYQFLNYLELDENGYLLVDTTQTNLILQNLSRLVIRHDSNIFNKNDFDFEEYQNLDEYADTSIQSLTVGIPENLLYCRVSEEFEILFNSNTSSNNNNLKHISKDKIEEKIYGKRYVIFDPNDEKNIMDFDTRNDNKNLTAIEYFTIKRGKYKNYNYNFYRTEVDSYLTVQKNKNNSEFVMEPNASDWQEITPKFAKKSSFTKKEIDKLFAEQDYPDLARGSIEVCCGKGTYYIPTITINDNLLQLSILDPDSKVFYSTYLNSYKIVLSESNKQTNIHYILAPKEHVNLFGNHKNKRISKEVTSCFVELESSIKKNINYYKENFPKYLYLFINLLKICKSRHNYIKQIGVIKIEDLNQEQINIYYQYDSAIAKLITDYCFNFTNGTKKEIDKTLLKNISDPVLLQNIELILNQKGACRHRANVAFQLLSLCNVNSRYVVSDIHAWVEIYAISRNNIPEWITQNLGGYPANITIKDSLPNDSTNKNSSNNINDYIDDVILEEFLEEQFIDVTIVDLGNNHENSKDKKNNLDLISKDESIKSLESYKKLNKIFSNFKQDFNDVSSVIEYSIKSSNNPCIIISNNDISVTFKILKLIKQNYGLPIFYIHSPEDIDNKWEDINLETNKITDGPLKKFIKYGKGMLVVNWDNFNHKQRACYKSVLDKNRSILDVSFKNIKVIGIKSNKDNDSEDFISRNEFLTLNNSAIEGLKEIKSIDAAKNINHDNSNVLRVDLYNSKVDWKSLLLGKIVCNNNKVIFKGTDFISAISNNKIRTIIIANPPSDSIEYRIFIENLKLFREFQYNNKIYKLSNSIKIIEDYKSIESRNIFSNIKFVNKVPSLKDSFILNNNTKSFLYSTYKSNTNGAISITEEGYLKDIIDNNISIIISSNIDKSEICRLNDSIGKIYKDHKVKAVSYNFLIKSSKNLAKNNDVKKMNYTNENVILSSDPVFSLEKLVLETKIDRDNIFNIDKDIYLSDLTEKAIIKKDNLTGETKFKLDIMPMLQRLLSGETVIVYGNNISPPVLEGLQTLLMKEGAYYYVNSEVKYISGKLILITNLADRQKLLFSNIYEDVCCSKLSLELIKKIYKFEKKLIFKMEEFLSKVDDLPQSYQINIGFQRLYSMLFSLTSYYKCNKNINYPLEDILGFELSYNKEMLKVYKNLCINIFCENKIDDTNIVMQDSFEYSYDDQIDKLLKSLEDFKVATLIGPAGTGKTYSINYIKNSRNIEISNFFGVDEIVDFLSCQNDKIKLLLLDEANMQSVTYSFLLGFRNGLVTYKGVNYKVNNHNVILTANPISNEYDAARSEKPILNEFPSVYFHPFSDKYLEVALNNKLDILTQNDTDDFAANFYLGKNNLVSCLIKGLRLTQEKVKDYHFSIRDLESSLMVYRSLVMEKHKINTPKEFLLKNDNFLFDNKNVENEFTGRILLLKALYDSYSGLFKYSDEKEKYFSSIVSILDVSKLFITDELFNEYLEFLKSSKIFLPQQIFSKIGISDKVNSLFSKVNQELGYGCLNELVISDTKVYQLYYLSMLINIRKLHIQGLSIGKTGILFEGPSGIGKSTLVTSFLDRNNLDYIKINVGSSSSYSKLESAFHDGKIVVLDEINLDNNLEKLLGQLLTGKDLTGKKAKKPGFMVIATSNPIFDEENNKRFLGRNSLSNALLNRMYTIYLSDYTEAEYANIYHEITKRSFSEAKEFARDFVEVRRFLNLSNRDLFKYVISLKNKKFEANNLLVYNNNISTEDFRIDNDTSKSSNTSENIGSNNDKKRKLSNSNVLNGDKNECYYKKFKY